MTNLDVSYKKCIKVIQSITTYDHFFSTQNYIENFRLSYNLGEQNDMIKTLNGVLDKKEKQTTLK